MPREPSKQGELFEGMGPPEGTVVVNGRCVVQTREGFRVVVGAGVPLSHYAVGDRMAEAHAIVSLVEQGWATQVEVAVAFGVSTRTVRRHQDRYARGGLAALGRPGGYPAGRLRLRPSRVRLIQRLKSEGASNRAIAARIGVTEKAVRKVLRRLGWKEPPRERQSLLPLVAEDLDPNVSALPDQQEPFSEGKGPPAADIGEGALAPGADSKVSDLPEEDLPVTVDEDPADRRGDRLLAYLGLLDDAAPLFASARRLPRAGVLLAIPGLLGTGVLECAREVFGDIGPAFYGLRTSVVAFVLLALLRVKRPEALKEHSPEDLGRLLGLDRAPEVKTLRRKLARLASHGRAAAFGRSLAMRRVAAHGPAMGFLYVDGHVRVYHGHHTLPKAHIARMRISGPATSDYWVNDAHGEPLFVVTAEANAGLVQMLPPVLSEVRALVGERRVTVVFDRGGWSPALFQTLIDQGFDVLTYRKGRSRRVPLRLFRERSLEIEGRTVCYTLADQGIALLGGKLRLRQVTRLSPTGHQTPIVTSRRDLADVEVAYRMFARWTQENFFKYLREEYALDALVEYAVEEDDAAREVPNPRHKELTAELRRAQTEATWIASRYGFQALGNDEQQRRTMRGFKIANAEDGRALRIALDRVDRLRARRAAVPRRVPVGDVVPGTVVKLAAERQHLSSLFKMVAYQAEGELANRLRPHYPRAEQEGRTLVQTALASAADIEVTATELRVTLAPLSSAHRSRALAALCEDLNRTSPCFPGTALRLRFAVAQRGVNRTDP